MSVLMFLPSPMSFGIDGTINSLFNHVQTFIDADASLAAQVVFGTILVFHALLGSAELLTGERSRLVSASFWFRIVIVGIITFEFNHLFVDFAKAVVVNPGEQIVTVYAEAWDSFWDKNFVTTGNYMKGRWAALSFWSLMFVPMDAMIDFGLAMIGTVLAAFISLLLWLYLYFLALIGIGMAGLVVAIGPICLPFGAHDATQDIALGYLKSFLVHVVFYMPLLLLGFRVAMEVLMSPGLVGLGSRTSGGFVEQAAGLIVCPLSAVAIVQSIPNFIKGALR